MANDRLFNGSELKEMNKLIQYWKDIRKEVIEGMKDVIELPEEEIVEEPPIIN